MRSDKYKKTVDFDGQQYSPELIRQYENPEYAKAAEEYERQELKRKKSQATKGSGFAEQEEVYAGQRSRGKKKKYRFRIGRLIRNVFLVFLIFFIGISGVFFALTGNFDKVDTEKDAFAIDSQVASQLRGYRNIAIMGVDARADEGYDGSRTDAIIIMSIEKLTGDVKLISVMRDSYLKMEYFDGQMILDKITHAHHYAGGVNTCAALNRSLDLNIDEFVIFNWKAVSDAVDCLGGIEIDVKENEIADMNTWGPETASNVDGSYTEITEAGLQTLDGVQATTYCRIRKTSGGDEGRGQRYKKVMAAVMKQALTHPWKLKELSDTVFPNVRTNMSQMELYTAALGAVRYDIQDNISWPEDYYAGLLSDGLSYVVPVTLESNVVKLHEVAFEQEGYEVSDTCRQISQEIINDTGLQ